MPVAIFKYPRIGPGTGHFANKQIVGLLIWGSGISLHAIQAEHPGHKSSGRSSKLKQLDATVCQFVGFGMQAAVTDLIGQL
ncbi:Uncharacterised protein [Serratia fonticola]|uniref:Uncharacterized protein n=1 Tax=Serratia fonticola TaxID=47917 RepID=A0A4U9VV58_SERFO|nr:Uncharacterised protein [Serratia fonticola]